MNSCVMQSRTTDKAGKDRDNALASGVIRSTQVATVFGVKSVANGAAYISTRGITEASGIRGAAIRGNAEQPHQTLSNQYRRNNSRS